MNQLHEQIVKILANLAKMQVDLHDLTAAIILDAVDHNIYLESVLPNPVTSCPRCQLSILARPCPRCNNGSFTLGGVTSRCAYCQGFGWCLEAPFVPSSPLRKAE